MMKLRMGRFVDSPAGSIGMVVIVVFFSELLIMLLVEDLFHPPFRPTVSALFWYFIDPVLVSALAGLTLYFTILRPLKKEQSRFKSILDTLSEAVALNEVVLDASGEMVDYRILEVNPAFHSTADFIQGGPIVGQLATKLYGMDTEVIREFWKARRRAEDEMETEMVSPISGKYFSVRTSPFFQGNFVTSFRDITKHKQAEEALRASEERYRLIFNNSTDAILLTSPNGAIDAANHAACKMFQCTEGEIRQLGRAALVDATDPRLAEALEERARTGNFSGELTCVRKGGGKFPAEVSTSVFRTNDGQIKASMIIRDVTERKRADENVRKLSMAVEQSPESIVITNLNSEIEYVNEAFVQKTGYSREDAIGKNPRILNSGKTPPETFLAMWEALAQGQPWRGDLYNRRKDGVEYIEHAVIAPIHQSDGRITHYVGVKEDITAHKQMEARLRDEQARLNAILETVGNPIFVKDNDHRVILANRAFCEMFGMEESLVLGHTLVEAVPQSERQHFLAIDRQVLDTGLANVCEETLSVGGVTREIITSKARLVAASGEKFLIGSIYDITERKKAEAELHQSQTQLRQLYASLQTAREEERRRLARELHDDLGQRVTALRMDLDWVGSKLPTTTPLLPAKMANVSVQIDELTDSIRRLIEDMRPGMLDVLGLAAAIDDYIDKFVARTGVHCELVTGDREINVGDEIGIGIFRIVQEALNNVQKYAQATHVLVRLDESSDKITLIVEDNGVGLPETSELNRQGFGIRGMNERVAILDGLFSIASKPGEGVRIEVVIPT